MQENITGLLNKFEKIIFEYLLEEYFISKKEKLRIPLYRLKKDLNMIPNLLAYISSLSSKKLELTKEKREFYYFNIIERYSIVNGYLNVTFSEEIYEMLNDEESHPQIYALLFRSKYSLKLLYELEKRERLEFTPQELRDFLNISDAYTRSFDLEKKIIKPTVEEIYSYLKLKINFLKEIDKNLEKEVKYIFFIDSLARKRIDSFKKSYIDIRKSLMNKI